MQQILHDLLHNEPWGLSGADLGYYLAQIETEGETRAAVDVILTFARTPMNIFLSSSFMGLCWPEGELANKHLTQLRWRITAAANFVANLEHPRLKRWMRGFKHTALWSALLKARRIEECARVAADVLPTNHDLAQIAHSIMGHWALQNGDTETALRLHRESLANRVDLEERLALFGMHELLILELTDLALLNDADRQSIREWRRLQPTEMLKFE